jgi:hypothetical protein
MIPDGVLPYFKRVSGVRSGSGSLDIDRIRMALRGLVSQTPGMNL